MLNKDNIFDKLECGNYNCSKVNSFIIYYLVGEGCELIGRQGGTALKRASV